MWPLFNICLTDALLPFVFIKYCAVLSKNTLKSSLHLPKEIELFVVFLKHEMRFLLDL